VAWESSPGGEGPEEGGWGGGGGGGGGGVGVLGGKRFGGLGKGENTDTTSQGRNHASSTLLRTLEKMLSEKTCEGRRGGSQEVK